MAAFWIFLAVFVAVANGQNASSPTCGSPAVKPVISSLSAKVRGGEEAKKNSWPWIARVGQKDFLGRASIFCGGTLISEKYVLTAAHCFPAGNLAGKKYFVRMGDHSTQVAEPGQKDYNVKKVIRHENFTNNNFGINNDIALLELESAVALTSSISLGCLPEKESDVLVERTCIITGWGSTVNQSTGQVRTLGKFFQQPILVVSNVLKQALQPILARDVCKQWWKPVPIRDSMVCTYQDADEYVANAHGEPCQGDSGGPLNCRIGNTDAWNVEGVVSFGAGCGQRAPAIFTRVSSYIDWIDSKMK